MKFNLNVFIMFLVEAVVGGWPWQVMVDDVEITKFRALKICSRNYFLTFQIVFSG